MPTKKTGKGKVRVGIKNDAPVHIKEKKPTGPPPKKIRMLLSLANKDMAFLFGRVYDVPHQVPVDTARRWVRSGAAIKVE